MAYWVWWITWAPFVGVFLAKISKGRTLREFVLASIMVPVGFLVIWFSVFSGFSLLDTVEGTGRLAEIANKGDYEGTFYYLLSVFCNQTVDRYPVLRFRGSGLFVKVVGCDVQNTLLPWQSQRSSMPLWLR